MTCEMCSGEVVSGVCRNCSTPAGPPSPVPARPALEDLPELPFKADLALAEAGMRAVLALADADTPEMEEAPARAVSTLLSMTAGYDANPTDTLAAPPCPPTPPGTSRATLSTSVPVRTACERCMLPVFGDVALRCVLGERALDGGQLTRLVLDLAARFQGEAQLAEQVAAAVVDLGGAESALALVKLRRPCDECGGGRATTTARVRRAAPGVG
jgi:GTP cyclohydrolase I